MTQSSRTSCASSSPSAPGGRGRPRLASLVLGLGLVLADAAPARAHGGLPIATQLLWRGQTLMVPTQYWGIFLGPEGGPWRWICDESINDYKLRSIYQGGDGALYATATTGLSVSRDGGCDWRPLGGDIAALEVDSVAADPQVADRLLVTTNQRDAQGQLVATLWAGEHLGSDKASWRVLYRQSGGFARGLTVSADAQAVHLLVASATDGQAPQVVASVDGAATFKAVALAGLPAVVGSPSVALLQSDFAAGRLYLRLQGDLDQVLVQASPKDGTSSELLRLQTPLYTVSLDLPRQRVLISTAGGLYVMANGMAPQRVNGLGRAQCAEVHGDAVYACSWNYFPDNAAVARSLDALADAPFQQTPRRLFQYADTAGVLSCPAGTSVATICPDLWAQNAPLLGITADLGPAPADMGTSTPQSGGGCQAAPAGRPSSPALALLLLSAALWGWRRRAASARSAP